MGYLEQRRPAFVVFGESPGNVFDSFDPVEQAPHAPFLDGDGHGRPPPCLLLTSEYAPISLNLPAAAAPETALADQGFRQAPLGQPLARCHAQGGADRDGGHLIAHWRPQGSVVLERAWRSRSAITARSCRHRTGHGDGRRWCSAGVSSGGLVR